MSTAALVTAETVRADPLLHRSVLQKQPFPLTPDWLKLIQSSPVVFTGIFLRHSRTTEKHNLEVVGRAE